MVMRLKRPVWALLVLLAGCHSAPPPAPVDYSEITCSAISPKDGSIVAGFSDGTLIVWDPTTGRTTRKLKWGSDKILFLAFSKNGDILCEDGTDGQARIWRWGSSDDPIAIKHTSLLSWIAVTPDGSKAAIVDAYRIVKIVDTSSGATLAELNHDSPLGVNVGPIAYSPDGRSIAISSDKASTRIWTLTKPGEHVRAPVIANNASVELAQSTCLLFSPNGRLLLDAGIQKVGPGAKSEVEVWNILNGRKKATLLMPNIVPYLLVSPDGNDMAVSSMEIGIWNMSNFTHSGHNLTGRIMSPNSFSPDGSLFAAFQKSEVDLYDAHTWTQLHTFKR
jgi:WD40 repeat protein